MKKSISLVLTLFLLISTFFCQTIFAEDTVRYNDSGSDVEISTSGGKQIQLVGHISPTIVSVTMPSNIPFDISFNTGRTNNVVSPVIEVQNNSNVPVSIAVDNTIVDLSKLSGNVTWETSSGVGSNGLAVGFSVSQTEPTTLNGAMWLKNGAQDLNLMTLGSQKKQNMFVVGAIGNQVPANGTFTVTPTLVVKKTA